MVKMIGDKMLGKTMTNKEPVTETLDKIKHLKELKDVVYPSEGNIVIESLDAQIEVEKKYLLEALPELPDTRAWYKFSIANEIHKELGIKVDVLIEEPFGQTMLVIKFCVDFYSPIFSVVDGVLPDHEFVVKMFCQWFRDYKRLKAEGKIHD